MPAAKDDHAPLLEVAHRAAADVGLGDLVHVDRGHDARLHAGRLQGVLQGQGVHDRGQHAHVVAGGPVHALGGRGQAPEDVAAADDDGDLHAAVDRGADLLRDEHARLRVDAVLARAEERLAGELEQDPAVTGALIERPGLSGSGGAVGHSASPSWKRTKRRTRMFSPMRAMASVTSSPTVISVSRKGCS